MSDDAPPVSLPPRTRDLQNRRRQSGRRPSPPRARTATRPPTASASQARLYTLGALGLCIVGLAACALGLFTVKTVQIVGRGVPAEAMVQAARVTGQNIFTVRSDDVIRRLETVQAVEVTKVETDFPDRVVIYAQLRQPVVAWQSPHGAVLIDRYGHITGPAGRTTLPVVVGSVPPDSNVITAIGYVRRLIPPAPDGAIASLSLDPRTGLSVHGRSGWQAVLGRGPAQVLVNRVSTLQTLLSRLARRGQHLTYADLRPKGAYYRVTGS